MIRLTKNRQVLGTGYHRSGWPLAYSALQELPQTEDGILVDDFVEQSWIYSHRTDPIDEPWIGFFHHPPNPPLWSRLDDRLDQLPSQRAFRLSIPNLKLAICLSEHVANWIDKTWNVRTAVVKHPTDVDVPQFTIRTFGDDPRVLQAGWYLRNTQLIHSIDTYLPRLKLAPNHKTCDLHSSDCKKAFATRPVFGTTEVQELGYVSNDEYDKLLSTCVVVMEVLDASANNVTLECLARSTPLIVNRHPAVVEYLGEDYPLYFDDHRQIAGMIENEALVLTGHEYLKRADKSFLSADVFASGIESAMESIL